MGIKLHLEKGVINMNRQTLLKHDNYIIVQHSHYPAMKIYRKKSLTTYHIQKLLAYQKAFDLTDMFFHNYSFPTAKKESRTLFPKLNNKKRAAYATQTMY